MSPSPPAPDSSFPIDLSRESGPRRWSSCEPSLSRGTPEIGGSAAVDAKAKLFPPAFVALLCVHPFLGFTFSSFVLLPKMLATTHGAGPAVIGQVTAAATLAATLAAFAGGPLIDRVVESPYS